MQNTERRKVLPGMFGECRLHHKGRLRHQIEPRGKRSKSGVGEVSGNFINHSCVREEIKRLVYVAVKSAVNRFLTCVKRPLHECGDLVAGGSKA